MSQHTIQAGEKPIHDIFNEKYIFSIPPYQRPYAWEKEQALELLDDIRTACGDEGDVTERSPYFLGSIVLIKDPLKPEAAVVDGQQRLTTLTILLCVLRDLAEDAEIAASIHGYVCQPGHALRKTPDIYRLTTGERHADFLRQTIQIKGATSVLPDPQQFDDAKARMTENATVLKHEVAKLSEAERHRLTLFLTERCFLVVVAASDADSAFRIFSVMNSRGLDLSPADIFKAEIIGALPKDRQGVYTRKWENMEEELGRERFGELFAHIRSIHRKQKMQSTLVAEFREHVKTHKQPATFIDDELSPYADAFEEITDQNFQSFKHADQINRQLTHLSRLDNFDWQPPAIEAIARRRGDPDFLLHFLTDLERLAYGLFLIRSAASDRIRRYGHVLTALQNGDDLFDPTSALQLDNDEKRDVKHALRGDIYTVRRIRLPLLLRLDEMLSSGSAVYTTPVMSVEHVLPQNPRTGSQWLQDIPNEDIRKFWVHKLANLVLLTQRKNSQASNYDFEEKKAKYFSSKAGVANFALTSQVLSELTWTEATLQKRQADLVDRIETLWRLK